MSFQVLFISICFFIFLSFCRLSAPCYSATPWILGGKEQPPRRSALSSREQGLPLSCLARAEGFREREHSVRTKQRGLFGDLSQFGPRHFQREHIGLESSEAPAGARASKSEKITGRRQDRSFQETDMCSLPPSSFFLKITFKMEMNFGLIAFLLSLSVQGTSEIFKPTRTLTLKDRARAKSIRLFLMQTGG